MDWFMLAAPPVCRQTKSFQAKDESSPPPQTTIQTTRQWISGGRRSNETHPAPRIPRHACCARGGEGSQTGVTRPRPADGLHGQPGHRSGRAGCGVETPRRSTGTGLPPAYNGCCSRPGTPPSIARDGQRRGDGTRPPSYGRSLGRPPRAGSESLRAPATIGLPPSPRPHTTCGGSGTPAC